MAYTFETPLRYLNQHPNKILKPYLKEGMTFLDIGCGMGFFSINAAKIVGTNGKVYSVDVQQKMLDIVKVKSEKKLLSNVIETVLIKPDELNLDIQADFALAMWVAHEMPDIEQFFIQVKNLLKPGGKLLVVEPTFLHIPKSLVEVEILAASKAGFEFLDYSACDFLNTGFLVKNVE